MRRLTLFAFVATVSGSTAAVAQQRVVAGAAARVVEAFGAREVAVLRMLAAKDDPDPWRVADELCFRGKHDAAEAFASAAPRADVAALPAYVASRRMATPDRKAHAAVAAARRSLRKRDGRAALAALEAVAGDAVEVVSAEARYGRGLALMQLRRLDDAEQAFVDAADLAERLGWIRRAADAWSRAGKVAFRKSDWRTARAHQERGLAQQRMRGHRAGESAALNNLGITCERSGALTEALRLYERALELSPNGMGRAAPLGNIGAVHLALGNYARSLEHSVASLRRSEKLGARAGMARVLNNLGIVYTKLGQYAKAVESYERAGQLKKGLHDKSSTAATLYNLGGVHADLGDNPTALRYYRRALALEEQVGHRAGMARAIASIAVTQRRQGDPADALKHHEIARQLYDDLAHRRGVATALSNIGIVHKDLGNYADALRHHEQALRAFEELADHEGVATTLNNMGIAHRRLGDFDKAIQCHETVMRSTVDARTRLHAIGNLAVLHLLRGRPDEATAAAREAVDKLTTFVAHLADEQGPRARGVWTPLFETGMAAALKLGNVADAFFFLESGRAGALLESLGGREAMRGATIPAELRTAADDARAAVVVARARHGRALQSANLAEIRRTRTALDGAESELGSTVARIQRVAKSASDVEYPKAASLESVRGSLAKGQALVSYMLLPGRAVALVVTRKGARIAELPKPSELEAVLQGQSFDDPTRDTSRSQETLRRHVITPLGLTTSTKRILVSPTAGLSYVPFTVLAREQEVVYVPSGTTYTVLLADRAKRGKKVLALGDPDYRSERDRRATSIYRSATRGELVPLPETAAEARAVGDLVLVGKRATEAALRNALRETTHWRAVHFACHGRVNAERPMLSSLAITPDKKNDGFLTVLEVFQSRIPSDLVVLSACETARGRVFRAEGIVGFTRAFMVAGAPRVIVSLWKVDDEATKTLMMKFYELWKPGDMATATALKLAQAHVASHAKWKHPYYWAAWQLWGLGD